MLPKTKQKLTFNTFATDSWIYQMMRIAKPSNAIVSFLLTATRHFALGGGGLAIFFLLLRGKGTLSGFLSDFLFNGCLWVVLGFGNGFLIELLDRYISWLEQPIKRLIYSLLITIVYTTIAGTIVFTLYMSIYYDLPASRSFQEVDKGFLLTVIGITIVVSLVMHGRGFLLSWRASAVEAEQHKRIALASKYESLKNQVNPHFLFNNLNVLSTLVYKDQDLAARFIKQMSKVYRYVLETKDQEVVSLKTELEALNAYIFLVKIRFGENLRFQIDIPTTDKMVVAPLTLQMLVENAIKHNVVSKLKPLSVQLMTKGDDILIINNLQPKSNQQESIGIGLPNIKDRYSLLSDRAVEIEETEQEFIVKVPIVKMENE